MSEITKVIRAKRAVLPDGERAVSVAIAGETIAAIGAYDADYGCDDVTELAADEVLLPGLIDIHVHVNEPGRTDWEGFETATNAAAAGGITTLIDMPLNSSPCTTSVSALEIKREVAKPKLRMDVGFWGGAVSGNVAELAPMWEEGVYGFKCFLGDSGLPEYPYLNEEELHEAMIEIARLDGLLIIHAEDSKILNASPAASGPNFIEFMNTHPASAEDSAIEMVIRLMRETGCRCHILHLASASALPLIRAAKAEGLPLTAETCGHYLTFDAEDIPDGATQFKCCPPLRGHDNRMGLWAGLADGTIDLVASDHSPCTVDLKKMETGDFGKAWGGIASVQLGFPAVWTEGRKLGHSLSDIVRWMAEAPADVVRIEGKGRIVEGGVADFAIVAPDEEWVVKKEELQHKNPVTPFDGLTLAGVVRATWLAGAPIDFDGPRRGRELIRRELSRI